MHDRLIRIENVVTALAYAIGAIGFLSVARYVTQSLGVGFACFYSISAVIEYRKIHFIPRWVLNLTAVSFIIFTFMRMSMDNFVLHSIEALSVLLLVKLFEEKRSRDYMQIYILSVFLLAGAALLSLDMAFFLYVGSLTALCSTALVLLTYYSQDTELALPATVVMKITTKSLLIPLVSIPVAIMLFIILPRTSYPLLDFLNVGATTAAAGFTDNVRLGAVSGIQEDTAIIFRSGMEKINEDQLYWRGIVLDFFDGVSWKSSPRTSSEFSSLHDIRGNRIEQTIYLEPYNNKYFFALDKPLNISLRSIQRRRDLTFSQSGNITRRIKYFVSSSLAEIVPEREIKRDFFLQLPGELSGTGNGKIVGLARRLTVKNDSGATVRSILSFLRNGDYRYSLQNLPLTRYPLEDFLFKYRYGNCEYFASAMAIMLRMAGIPSRLVGGYRGGYYNEIGKYYLIQQKNAHVWVEVYMDNLGWMRVDPTPADSATGPNKNVFLPVRLLFDTFSYYWNAVVINYNFEAQLSLLTTLRAGLKKPGFNFSLKKTGVVRWLLFSCLLAGAFYVVRVVVHGRKSRSEHILSLFLRKTSKLGYFKMKSEGLEEFLMKIDDMDKREKASLFVKEFERYYFRDEAIKAETSKRLKNLIKAI